MNGSEATHPSKLKVQGNVVCWDLVDQHFFFRDRNVKLETYKNADVSTECQNLQCYLYRDFVEPCWIKLEAFDHKRMEGLWETEYPKQSATHDPESYLTAGVPRKFSAAVGYGHD